MNDLHNPYWDAVKDLVSHDPSPQWGGPVVEQFKLNAPGEPPIFIDCEDYRRRYAWTITDPGTIAFIAEHATGLMLDPMAGNGYWPYLLRQTGLTVTATDLAPLGSGVHNPWVAGEPFCPVDQAHITTAINNHPDHMLFLSWPPQRSPVASRALNTYKGDRFIYVGELNNPACNGGKIFWQTLARDWNSRHLYRPVQWFGMHDYVVVYERAS